MEEEEEGEEEFQGVKGGGGAAPEPLRAPAGSGSGPGGAPPSSEDTETIWDRLRGPKASEANAASAEAAAEGRIGPGARAREEEKTAPKLGGGTGVAL